MTTFEKTWQQHNNVVPSDQTSVLLQMKSLLWWIKAFLKGDSGNTGSATIGGSGLWTCYYSCDGTTAGVAADGVDRWGTGAAYAFDATKLVRAAVGVAHSWMVLFNATLGMYMLIDYAGAQDYQCEIRFSQNAFTGGTTTTAPTATNSWTHGTSFQLSQSAIAGSHYFGILATDGSFHLRVGRDGSSTLQAAVSLFPCTSPHAGDASNFVSYVDFLITGTGVWAQARLAVNVGHMLGRNGANTANVTNGGIFPYYLNSSGVAASVLNDIGTTDAVDGLFDDYPLGIYTDTAGSKSIRGRCADIFCCPISAPAGNVEPNTGPPYQSCIMGNFWFPYNASIAPSL